MRISKEGLKRFFGLAFSLLARFVSAICVLCGIAAIGYGCWLVYQPSAFIVVGAILLWIGLPDKEPAK